MNKESMEFENCSCDMPDEPYDTFSDVEYVASKHEHVLCDECCRIIKPGETYNFVSVLTNRVWDCSTRCRQCYAIARDYLCGVLGEGAVWEMARQILGVDIRNGETEDEYGRWS